MHVCPNDMALDPTSLRLYRATEPPNTGLVVEIAIGPDGPVIFYGHDGIDYDAGQYLKRWAQQVVAPDSRVFHILTDTGPDPV